MESTTSPMPDHDNIPALASWLNASASELIQDIMTRHTSSLLDAMKNLVDERDSLRAMLREKETAETMLQDRISNMERDYSNLLKSYHELRKKHLEATGQPDLYPYSEQ